MRTALSNLFCHAFNISRYFLHSQLGGVTWWRDAGKPPQQIGQFSRHGARLVAVELRQRLGLKVLEHEECIVPVELHLQNTAQFWISERQTDAGCEPEVETRCARDFETDFVLLTEVY